MQMKLKKSLAILWTMSVITSSSVLAYAFPKGENDFEKITDTGVSLHISQKLNITQPSDNITTSASSYLITGTSNPNLPLYLNGTEVTKRGRFGSFAMTVNLAEGKNTITVTQGENSDRVYITRTNNPGYTSATAITNAFPIYDTFAHGGEEVTLKCVAPAGSRVYADFMGKRFELKQNVPSASKGIAANFSIKIIIPKVSEFTEPVKITYTLNNDGNTSVYESEGTFFAAPQNEKVLIQATEVATPVYTDKNGSYIKTIVTRSTVDKVIEQDDGMYKLAMGGWVSSRHVKPLLGNYSHINTVTDISRDFDYLGESYLLKGNSYPPYEFINENEYLKVILYNTKNVPEISVQDSEIFSDSQVSYDGVNTTITFYKKNSKSLWGYGIEYKEGKTVIYCKKPPVLSSNPQKPLEGIVVTLDPGHGGKDPGALGTAQLTGSNEKDFTLATSMAVKNRLEDLGAQVIMTRTDDSHVSFNERMDAAIKNRADFFISIHYNSGTPTASGSEVYYYYGPSAKFARSTAAAMTANTSKNNRGVFGKAFRVVLNPFCPSILTEVEFISNPVGYDDSLTKTNHYNVANAMADSIINLLTEYNS